MIKTLKFLIIGLFIGALGLSYLPMTHAMDAGDMKTVCANFSADDSLYPKCANTPRDCKSIEKPITTGNSKEIWRSPINCLFIEEPIGGKKGEDLFMRTCGGDVQGCKYELWNGSFIDINDPNKKTGPHQAYLVYIPGNELYGNMGLLYSYVGNLYNWLSGIIVAFVVLVSIIGGIRMIVSNGDQGEYDNGRKMITKAMVGMVIWFLASLILYFINPTFFSYAT